jgi:hypothetical protein
LTSHKADWQTEFGWERWSGFIEMESSMQLARQSISSLTRLFSKHLSDCNQEMQRRSLMAKERRSDMSFLTRWSNQQEILIDCAMSSSTSFLQAETQQLLSSATPSMFLLVGPTSGQN